MKKLSLLFAALLTATVMNLHAVDITSWTIAGDESMMGSYWDPADTNNDMRVFGGSYQLKKFVNLTEGDYGYKAVANHQESIKDVPSSGYQTVVIEADGDYIVTFTLDAAGTTLTAEAELYTSEDAIVDTYVNDESMGHVTGGGEYAFSSNVTLTAVPNAGYKFVNWSGDQTGTTNPLTFKVTTVLNGVQANFEAETPAGPDMHDFLYFVGLNGNDTVRLNKYAEKDLDKLTATFEFSKDRKTWTPYDTWATSAKPQYTYQGNPIALNQGDTVWFRALGVNKDGLNATIGVSNYAAFTFAFGADDSIAVGGNTMSLYDATCKQDTMTAYGFFDLFKGAKQLVSAPKLPATKLASGCYYFMFLNTNLTTAPTLPATTLANSCYYGMFKGCSALIKIPELKATILADNCYLQMFSQCTSLEIDTCADGNCDGVMFNPTHSGTAPSKWNRLMFASCHGAYAANIQLGGHYCIKEYVEPDTVVVNCIPSYGARQFYPQDNDFFIGIGNNDYSARFDILLPTGTTELVYGKEYTLSDMDQNFSFFTIVQPFSQPAYQSCSLVRIGLNYYATAILVGDPNTIYLINYIADTYTRPVTKGNFGTICLDKKFTAMKGVEGLYVPYEKNDTVLYCEEVSLSDVVAGGAYIFKADSDAVVFSIEGDAATAVNNDHMIGWLAGDSVLAQAPAYYMLYNNQLVAPLAGSTIKENRAFIDLEDVPAKAAAPARGRLIKFGIDGTNTTTGMNQLTDSPVNQFTKMMINGQLIIIREGRKFNAQGQEL